MKHRDTFIGTARLGWTVLCGGLGCLAAATALGCTTFLAPLTCPERGGPDWVQVASDHFTLKTDMPESAARDRLEQFEQSFQALSELAFRSSDPPAGRTDVVVFSRMDDYQEIAPPHTAGFFASIDVDRRPIIVMYGPYSDRARQIFQHELTHRFVRHFMPRAPTWLNEGLAEFYETLQIDGRDVVLGAASSKRTFDGGALMTRTLMGWTTVGEVPSATELLDAPPTAFRDPRRGDAYYAGSWLLVSMLIHGPERYERRFWSFIDGLADGRRAEDAWRMGFASLPTGELAQAFSAFVRRGEIVVERARFSPRPISFAAPKRMSDEDIHTLWAMLMTRAGENGARAAQGQLSEVLARSPRSAEAHHWSGLIALALLDHDEAEAHFREASALVPHEERHLLGLCLALHAREMRRPPAQRDLLRLEEPMQRLATRARSAAALNALGRYHAELDRPDEGWPFAERAVQLAPSCAECLDTLALLAFKKGRVHKALELQRWALTIMPEGASVEGVIERLRRYERAAAAAPPDPDDPPAKMAPSE